MLPSFVNVTQQISLANLGIGKTFLNPKSISQLRMLIKFPQHYQNNAPQLTIIDQENNFAVNRRPAKSAQGAIMHLNQNIFTVKASNQMGKGHLVQIFNMVDKKKLKNLEFNQNIIFWKWVSPSIMGLVSNSSVYHVDISNQQKQVKIFDRDGPLKQTNQVQIIGYHLAPDANWAALNGISTPDEGKTIVGHIQLFKIQDAKQQIIEGYACCFGKAFVHNDTHKSTFFCFVQKKQNENMKVQFNEISSPPEGSNKFKRFVEINLQQGNDFPIYMHICQNYGLLIILTKFSNIIIYEISNVIQIWRSKLSQQTIFIACKNRKTEGAIAIGKSGSIYSLSINQNNYLPFLIENCKHIPNINDLAFKLATRYKLQGIDKMFVESFNKQLISSDYYGAAKTAASSPPGLLRNPDTIKKFKALPQLPNQAQPILIYFQELIKKGGLNKIETIQLCTPYIQQGKSDLIRTWFEANKLQACEQLGDAVRKLDKNLSLKIYQKAKSHQKVVEILTELGQVEMALKYSQQTGAVTDYMSSLKSLFDNNPESALNFAKVICNRDKNINVHQIAEMFFQRNRFQELSSFCVECMKGNKPQDGQWQTKVLEINILGAPQVAQAIFQMHQWNQYNRVLIANLCEQKGMYQRALQNYSDIKDIKRVLNSFQLINQEFLGDYFSTLQPEIATQCLSDLLRNNRQSINLCTKVCLANLHRFGLEACINIFESTACFEGMYYLLGSVDLGTDFQLHYKYIEAAAKCNNMKVVQQIIKTKADCYDPNRVKNMLLQMRLNQPRPLIFLCDLHNQIDELVKYLYKNNQVRYIEIYLLKVNLKAAPIVLGTLIDMECEETYIKQLLNSLKSNCPMESLIQEFEKRNRLRVMENWLEQRVAEGIQIVEVHNALAKIKVDTNQQPAQFLAKNAFYDSKVVGKFCQDRDPHLAVIAYRRAWGLCDQQFIMVTNKNSLFRLQAKYLVERQSKELWKSVLSLDNPYRKSIIDQVVTSALPDSKNIEEVSITVQAFLAADLPSQLISLLQKIVLHSSEFGKIKKLQNLLIITAIKSDKSRVMDYINRLDNYDGPQIAKIAIGQNHKLYEEAYVIYKKHNMNLQAIQILLDYMNNLEKAAEFAEKINQIDVWTKLGNSYLDRSFIHEAIDCFMKAKNSNKFMQVIEIAEHEGKFDILIKYLLMVRSLTKDIQIDNALCYAYACQNRLNDLESFLSNPNSADAQKIGDRCFNDGKYEAAKLLYTNIKNNAKIAGCLIALKQYAAAIQTAKKANTPKTWKELCMACVAAQEEKLASIAGLNIIVHPDHLQELIQHYEANGVQQWMINLLQTGMGLQRAHVGIFTELGILYGKYRRERLMEHCKAYFQKLNVSKLLRVCEKYMLWPEAVYLYTNYNEFDNAINTMIEHSPSAFAHEQFIVLLQKVTNSDYYYRAIEFYVEEEPMLLNDLLKSVLTKVDYVKTVRTMKALGYLPLVEPFLKTIQNCNSKQVNEALNQIYLEENNYEALRVSITQYENFDSLSFANQIKNHQLLEFRRIASYLFRKLGKYQLSMNLSKNDEMYRDAIETAQESGSGQLIESILEYFVENKFPEFVTVTLYTCYQYIRPDIVLEYSWRYKIHDFTMPYMIQLFRDLTCKVDYVEKKHEDRQKKEKKKEEEQMSQPIDVIGELNSITTGFGLPMLGGEYGYGANQSYQSIYTTMPYNMGANMNLQGQGKQGYNQFSSWR